MHLNYQSDCHLWRLILNKLSNEINLSVYYSKLRMRVVSWVHFAMPSTTDLPPSWPILFPLLRLKI